MNLEQFPDITLMWLCRQAMNDILTLFCQFHIEIACLFEFILCGKTLKYSENFRSIGRYVFFFFLCVCVCVCVPLYIDYLSGIHKNFK